MRLAFAIIAAVAWGGCGSIPKPRQTFYSFPKEAYIEAPKRPMEVMGTVRSRANFMSLDVRHEEYELCKSYFNKAVTDLVRMAKERGADAVVDVRSVVFLEDGRVETYSTPECSDDGEEGQALAQGTAVKWKGKADEKPSPGGTHNPFAIPEGQQPKPRIRDRIKPAPSPKPKISVHPTDPVLRQ